MRFGVFLGSSLARGGAPIVASLVEQAELMEQLGYDVALLGERHQRPDGYVETLTTLAWLLARTGRLRVGSGGFILPIHHPYRIAQQAAALDQASGGRLVLGVVLGYNRGDFAPFGVPTGERAARFEESLAVIRRLWTGERVTHRGRFWTLDDVFIAPAPRRASGPPVWIGAKVDAAIRRAAVLGDGCYAELGVTTLVLRCQFPGMGHADALRGIERFGAEVMPHFHDAAPRAGAAG